MRVRPIVAFSVIAASAILLAGCSTPSEPSGASAAPSPTGAPGDLCAAAIADGAVVDSVKVTGDAGKTPEVEFATPLQITAPERTVLKSGEGKLENGDFVLYAYTIYDGSSGEEISSKGYKPGELLPEQASPDGNGQLFGCEGPGARIAAVAPPQENIPGGVVYVLDILKTVPTSAWGEQQEPTEGMPEVKLGDDGAPTITIPDADPPKEVTLATLKKGDGATVEPGDTVLVQYTGVRWSTGEVFDSSWKTGVPASFQTTGVVEGFKQALEGYTVGSQVEVVMPPKAGYGEGEINETDLKGETLVFVVDILGTQHADAAPAQ